jgi:hypothetical protein
LKPIDVPFAALTFSMYTPPVHEVWSQLVCSLSQTRSAKGRS